MEVYVVPVNVRKDILDKCHNSIFNGHLGSTKTISRAKERFYWPNMDDEIVRFIQECEACQKIKPPRNYNVSELMSLTPTRPLELVTAYIMGPLPITSARNQYLLVICDHFSKWTMVYPLVDIKSEKVAEKLMEYMCIFGIPETILT